METVQRCKHEHVPGKERKPKQGIETAAHNFVEIESSLYVITHITGFRLGHKWNRTTMGDNTVTGLVTIAVLIQESRYCYGLCEFLLRFREGRRLRLTYKTLECLLQIKTEGTDPLVLFDSNRAVEHCHWWCKCQAQGKCQPCYIVMRITVNSVCHA